MKSFFLQAFEGTNTTIPVWFMRQAGRYLPDYQAIKQKYSLEEMFDTPELAAQITCMPIDILKVDAAIVFADILTLPRALGFQIRFDDKKGPVIAPFDPNQKVQEWKDADLEKLKKTIRLCKERLPNQVPLIGFAGSPFTVLTYLIQGGSSASFGQTFKLMHETPERFHFWMEALTQNTIQYLNLQKKAGIDVFQIFDTWAGILRPADYAHFVLPYITRIFEAIDLPSIYYVKNCQYLLPLLNRVPCDVLSVCHTVVLGHQKTIEKTQKGVQGNLFNGILFTDQATLKKEVRDVCIGGSKHKKFIFNLSHGVLPQTSVDQLKAVVDWVHTFSLKS